MLKLTRYTLPALPIVCLCGTILVQCLNPCNNPLQHAMSSLVWGKLGFLQTMSFMFFGLIILYLAQKMLLLTKCLAKVGAAMLALTGLILILTGVFPEKYPDLPATSVHTLHLLTSSIVICLFPLSCILMARHFHSKRIRVYTLITGIVGMALTWLQGALYYSGLGWMGTFERLEYINGLVWAVIILKSR